MTWPLRRPNPPPFFVLGLENFHPTFAEGIVAVAVTGSAGIVVEGNKVVDIMVVDIEQADTEPGLVQLAYAHHFSSSGYPPSFPAAAEVLCSIFRLGLLIYKIYSTD